MNILVIGNGFDLAHGLPTRYGDLLKWIQVVDDVLKVNTKQDLDNINWRNINEQIKTLIIQYYYEDKFGIEYKKLIKNNYWVEHFLSIYEKLKKQNKENWIDFENEMSNVIQTVDNKAKVIIGDIKNNNMDTEKIFPDFYYLRNRFMSLDDIRDELYNDLNKLIRLLEIYLSKYIDLLEIKTFSPEIMELINEKVNVISFNYTKTYDKLKKRYGNLHCEDYEITFIHGKAYTYSTIEDNDMVLGINEYLDDNEKNTNVEFIGFKKYFQCIYKRTDIKYKDWIKIICNSDLEFHASLMNNTDLKKKTKTNSSYCNKKYLPITKWCSLFSKNYSIMNDKNYKIFLDDFEKETNISDKAAEKYRHIVYFYGHSLDTTDSDVIRDLILHDTVRTIIFYYAEYENDKRSLFDKISNLVKIIGQDELIRRTSERSLIFVPQEEMKPL